MQFRRLLRAVHWLERAVPARSVGGRRPPPQGGPQGDSARGGRRGLEWVGPARLRGCDCAPFAGGAAPLLPVGGPLEIGEDCASSAVSRLHPFVPEASVSSPRTPTDRHPAPSPPVHPGETTTPLLRRQSKGCRRRAPGCERPPA